ncbi:hypothetical protein MOQ_007842 [Trypanosoma cruzi marinkellei]|uniref:tRNA intron endonuclease catalytic domain-containing protein n=1 Tax=Trypanosoma cruzi marinkellei TaxID=85056 RepID=K2M0C6_TRYCR|nr:hypothetical protein MOQ_007842 [Trypanosoma cruzi marinkellei]
METVDDGDPRQRRHLAGAASPATKKADKCGEEGGEEANDDEKLIVRIIRTHGPLFVCEDPSLFLQTFPQARKKHYHSDHLSIEELEYLGHSFDIVFKNEHDSHRRACLRERHATSCRVYRYLTDEMGLRLRHGSQFGAAFIGYRDVNGHGEYLVYLGPLSRLEEVAAVRVARSVAKEAWVAEELHDGSGFSFTRLSPPISERSPRQTPRQLVMERNGPKTGG